MKTPKHMQKPTHIYVEFNKDANTLTAHYGKLRPVMESKICDLGAYTIPFEHPNLSTVCYFEQIGAKVHPLNGQTSNELRKRIKNDAKKRGISVVKQEDIYSLQKLLFFEVEMATAKTVRPSGALYTRSLGACIGISIYNPKTHYSHLFHTPGCDRETMPSITGHLERILSDEEGIKGGNVEVNIASGLFAPFFGYEVEEAIRNAREELMLFFFSRDIEPTTHFAEENGEAITFMSVRSNGLVEIIKEWIF